MKTALKRLMWETEASMNDQTKLWAQTVAATGAVIWAILAVLARKGVVRVGAIELMFIFAPLVIVPLGLELIRVIGDGVDVTRRILPFGTALAVAAIILPPGPTAGILSCGWLVVCMVVSAVGVIEFVSAAWSEVASVTLAVAKIDLAVGGAWFVASRFGMRPLGIQEPIGLLTAVHFHFAGFATAAIAAATLRFAEKRRKQVLLKFVVAMVAGMPYMVAAGFVISPLLKMASALLFSACVAALAIAMRNCGKRAEDFTSRVLLQVAPVAIFAGMILSGSYAVTDFRGSDALTIPQMARTHGILNAVGFCLPGLLGWLLENDGRNTSA